MVDKYFETKKETKTLAEIKKRIMQARSEGKTAFSDYLKLIEEALKRKFSNKL